MTRSSAMSRWFSDGTTTADAITSPPLTLLLPKQPLLRIARGTSGSHIRSQPVRNTGVIALWLIVHERTASAKGRAPGGAVQPHGRVTLRCWRYVRISSTERRLSTQRPLGHTFKISKS